MPNENSATWGMVSEPICSRTRSHGKEGSRELGKVTVITQYLGAEPNIEQLVLGNKEAQFRECKSPKHKIHDNS